MSHYLKRITWLAATLFACLAITQTAQAASFDCAKAKSKVERLICGDEALSKLDDEMGRLYHEILQNSSNDPVLKKTQRDRLKYRQQCLTSSRVKQERIYCLAYRYQHHNITLRGSLPTEPDAGKDAQQLCVRIASLVETREAFKLEPEAGSNPPRGSDYQNIDLDGDGIADSVKTSCGTGECNLEVKLSSGGEFDFGDALFYLIRYQQHIYALVSYSEDDESKDPKIKHKYHLGRLYLITPTEAKMVCGN